MATVTTRAIGDPTRLADYQNLLRGHIALSMTNMDSTSEPTFTGTVELNGTILITLSADSGTGWAGLDTSSDVWVYVQSTGAVVYSATAPSWDADKAGWYNSNDRAIAWMRKDSADGYRYKRFLPNKQESSIVFVERLEIGDWNMDATATHIVAHEMEGASSIYTIRVGIRRDSDAPIYPGRVNNFEVTGVTPDEDGTIDWDGTDITLYRGASFDSTNYNETSYNRGWITMWFEAALS